MLEIGCGSGGLAAPMRALGVNYDGIDLDPRPIEAAHRRRQADGLRVADFMDESFDGSWDVIFATQVLEHITEPRAMVEKLAASLTPGGILHLDVPNQRTLAGLPSRIARGYRERFGAIEWPHHAIAYQGESLRHLLAGLFKIQIFRSTPADDLWGQAVTPNAITTAYFRASAVTRMESLLVGYGRALPQNSSAR